MQNHREHLAIIGSGPSSIYLLKHLLDGSDTLTAKFQAVSIFEKSDTMGMGMPYNPATTDRFNMSNISSEEVPELPMTFGDWLRGQEPSALKALGVEDREINDHEIYSRLSLGQYLKAQYQTLVRELEHSGIQVVEHPDCEVIDMTDLPDAEGVSLMTSEGVSHHFDRVVIATGHRWAPDDRPESGYFASPWPISKLLPGEGAHHNFPIGTLGASLSAFDVVSSLAHRHGEFVSQSGKMTYHPHAGTEDFKIVMHSAHGLLPHLQFDQDEPMREIYRHIDREDLLALVSDDGFLRLDTFFDKVCRPVLITAFKKDGKPEMVERLSDPQFKIGDFAEVMTDKHDYADAFEGMRVEMKEARESVEKEKPIHWKEVLDDLMYTLNFHAELLPAEDHLTLQSKVMPFLMNVIAAMPLPSGNTILALHDAGKLGMIPGKASVCEEQSGEGMTAIIVKDEEKESTISYRMFIDCSGQKPLELDEYPFPSLVKQGAVRKAQAPFADSQPPPDSVPDKMKEQVFRKGAQLLCHTGGIDVDRAYRLIGNDDKPNLRIHDIAFPHISGVRPYSYGLQACNDTSAILVQAWIREVQGATPTSKRGE